MSAQVNPVMAGTKRACTHADQCSRRDCVFDHPSGNLCPSFPKRCGNFAKCGSRHPAIPTGSEAVEQTPVRLPCFKGDSCVRPACKFFHDGGLLCKFFPACSPTDGSTCPFRHPSARSPGDASAESPAVVPIKVKQSPGKPKGDAARAPKEPSPPKEKGKPKSSPGKPAAKPKLSMEEMIDRAISTHDRIIAKEEEELRTAAAASSKLAVGRVDSTDDLTQRAMFAKIKELRDQRAVFLEVISRLQVGDIHGSAPLTEAAHEHVVKRELYRFNARLPALAKRLEIEACLSNPSSRFCVIQGQTGSGKSTQIPQYAADLACFAGKRIICTQPRKLAATSLAARVAFEYSAGWEKAPVGGDIGYRVGGRVKTSSRTRVEYVTEAVLLDMITCARRGSGPNPFEDVGCVVVDEAHERSITCDLIMGSLKEHHSKWRHVKVAITSATIDLNLFSGFFEKAPVVEIPGRMFPVDVQYVNPSGQSGVVDAATVASVVAKCALMIQQAFPDPREGDILCFLPGQDDVLRAKESFESSVAKLAKISPASDRAFLQRVVGHALYGKQDPEEQALVFKKDAKNRKVIFATDVAETSVTIDGVVFVVDSGLRKAMVYDPLRNMSSLKVHTVSRSSALQRCGRAGRTRPGKCFRLYSQQDFDEMEIGNAAEIFQQPLTLALLTLCHVGIRPREFHWIEAPNADAMARAEAELVYLGALDERSGVTALGRLVAEVQIDPKLVRLIDRAAQQHQTQAGVDLVAVLSVANIAYHRGKKNDKASKADADKKRDQFMLPEQGDVVSLYRTYCAWKTVLEGSANDASSNDDPPSPPKPETSGGADEDDDEEEGGGGGWMEAVAANLMQLKVKAVATLSNKLGARREDDDSDLVLRQSNDDDDDATSVSSMGSMGSEASSVADSTASSKSFKKPKRHLNENKARKWCMANGVNGKAMGIARATAKELLQTLSRAKSWPHGKVEGDAVGGSATDAQLRRLLASGFFLNAAANKPTSTSTYRRGGPQYFALYAGVLGSLFMGSAIHLDEKKSDNVPAWIVFDSILRLNGTTFLSLATPIEDDWIRQESPAFYEICAKSRAELPVDTLEYPKLSLAVLRNLFGKSFQQVNRWETQLKSTISIDRETGTLSIFCAPIHKAQIQVTIDNRLATLQKQLAAELTEEVYMGTTRALVGHGFQVEQLLFDKEFIGVSVRNLPNLSDRELEQRLLQWARAAGCSRDAIRSADVLRGNNNNNATVSVTLKFTTKEAAAKVCESMRGETSGGEALSVTPLRKMGDQSGESTTGAEFAGRIKLTWADGDATGEAKVFFRTSFDANAFILSVRSIFPSTAINAFAIGQMPDEGATSTGAVNLNAIGRGAPRKPSRGGASPGKPNSGGVPPPPAAPVKKELTGVGSAFRVLFDTDAISNMPFEQQARLRFGVHVKGGLPSSMDETELVTKIRPTSPGIVYAKVSRKPTTSTIAVADLEMEVRFRRMFPLLSCLDETTVYTDFVDQSTRRAGVVVFCRDLPRLRETYQMARDSPLWEELEKPHGQPIRMELEYSYTTVLHADLHRCFREQIAEIMTYGRAKGVMCQESQPTSLVASASKNMVTLKFLGELPVLQRLKDKLDETMSYEKVESPDINKLFSIAGRRKVEFWMAKHIDENNAKLRYFIRWINKKNEFWVYGDAPSRKHGVDRLLRLIEELKSLEVLDQIVRVMVPKDPKDAGAKAAKEQIRPWLAKSPEAKALYSYFAQSNRCLFVSGSKLQVAALTQALQRGGLLFEPRKRLGKYANAAGAKPDCGVCSCPVDEPSITLTKCNHAFCLECIQPMIQPATCTLPITCPTGCGETLHTDDVAKIVNDAESMSRLVETAVFDYVVRHTSEAFECPKPGCNQILNTAAVIGSSGNAVGGRSVYCDQCHADYCLDCTEAAGRPIKRHAKQTCTEFRARQVSPQVAQHLRTIQEQILNVSCPQCRAVFLDFTGCTSVQCGNTICGHYFCANCLAYSSTSSGDTHNHVARCPNNPNAACGGVKGYFVSDEQLAATHRALRTQKLTAFFNDRLTSDSTRHAVYKRLAKDLSDLGIDLPSHLRGSDAGGFSFDCDEDEGEEDKAVRQHAQHVREHLLNLKCPKCNLVFVDFDFDSCAALTCANPACAGGFCAYCLAACGNDAHSHVSGCEKNPNRPYFYVTEEEFHRVHKERREKLVASYLRNQVAAKDGAEMVQRVKAALAEDFRSLELDATKV